jgi:hypothetical protein
MFPASTKGGGVEFSFPDVCKTPTPGGPVPIPYPNGTYEVKNSASKSTVKSTTISSSKVTSGDEAGKIVGVISSITMGKLAGNAALLKHLVDKAHAKGLKVMIDVKVEGKAVIFLQSIPQHNYSTTRSNPTPITKVASRRYIARSGTEGMEWLLRHLD